MNKRLKVALVVIAVLAVAFTGCSSTVSYKDCLNDYVKTMDYEDGFTILQLTDIHWNPGTEVGDGEYGSEAYILKVVEEAKAHAGKIDLIEVTGDTFMLSNKFAVKSFIDFMEDLAIPYAMVWGNHDRQAEYSPNWLCEQFLNAPYCLYTEVDNDDVHERGNYVINLEDESGDVMWQLVQLDSGASYREGAGDMGLDYDFIRQDQLDWFKAEHDMVGADVPVICYYHVPQADCNLAMEAIKNGDTGYRSMFFALEDFCPSEHAGFTSDFFAQNNVQGVFMGHDHNVDWTYTDPNGITYGYGVKTGTGMYYTNVTTDYEGAGFEIPEDFTLVGATLVTLDNSEGDFTLEHLYLNERDEGDFVLWVKYE